MSKRVCVLSPGVDWRRAADHREPTPGARRDCGTPEWEVVEVYADEISGTKGRERRPAFDHMLKAAVHRKFDMIAAWSVDRLGRSLQDLVGFLGELNPIASSSRARGVPRVPVAETRPGHAVGHAKVREYFDSYVGTLAGARLALVDQELRKLGEGVYIAQGYAAFDFDLTAGGATRTVLRSTLVLTRRPGGWRIAQHHFSSPPSEPPIPPPQAAQS
jgi:ketosteroid isomerase-like protein